MTKTKLIEAEFKSGLIPHPVEYAVLLPENREEDGELPLLYYLHGGGGDRNFLGETRALLEGAMSSGQIPPLVAVTVSAGRSLYMDYRDGSQKWETLLTGEFLEFLRATYPLSPSREKTLLTGPSMGGMGSLRLGLKNPHVFGALAAIEPGIEPALAFGDIQLKDRFWRSDEMFEEIFGSPVDEEYWQANNPANIVLSRSAEIRASGLAIYLECGDQDFFNLHGGAELLHRLLWDYGVKHEYHSVRGADHVGRSLGPRMREGLGFLGRHLNPDREPDPKLEMLYKRLGPLKTRLGLA